MKTLRIISALTLMLAAILSCEKDTTEPTGQVDDPFVSISVTETGTDFVNAAIKVENATSLFWLCLSEDGKADAEHIMTEGTEIKDPAADITLNITGLTQNTDYTLYILAVNGDKQFMSSSGFRTEEDILADAVELTDGFLAYDGIDEASGMYRTNIMLCSEAMGSGTLPYYDVLIYVYTSFPLERIDQNYREIPFGDITPFYTNGQGLTDMMYYIGKHVTDQYGEPNCQGTAWLYYKEDGTTDIFVADDTDNTHISISDNGDGSYTISGTLVDMTRGKELKFVFTDDKPVFSIDQTM